MSMRKLTLKVYSICCLIMLFGSGPLLGSHGVFDCDERKLNTINHYLEPCIRAVASNNSDENQKELYTALLNVRDGTVLKDAQHESLLALVSVLPMITKTYEGLDERAALNLANAKYYLANEFPDSQEAQILYQESYYLYSLLSRRTSREDIKKASNKNMNKLLNEEKVRLVTQTQTTQEEVLMPIIEEQVENFTKQLNVIYQGIPNYESLIRAEINKFKEEMLKDLLSVNRGIEEEKALQTNPIPDIELTETHLSSLTHILEQVIYFIHTTPLMKNRHPVLVPVGRSVAWIVKLWEKLPLHELNVEIPPMTHILASGLSKTSPTKNQKLAYKSYLDQLGFGEYGPDHEIFFLDVSETGATFQRIQVLIEELYPELENHTQNIALLYNGDTTNLEQTRVCYMEDFLREPMFAKHSEKQYYCPFPTFYPENWERGLSDFSVPEGALKFEEIMDKWIEKEGYSSNFSMISALF